MNFITELLPLKYRKKAYNAILIIVDQFFKIIYYISYTKKINASELTNRLIEIVFLKKKTSRFIISNRESIFMSKY